MMTFALMLALMADGLPIDVLKPQALPARGCAAYLFAKGDTPAFVAMASADPAQLRISIGGAVIGSVGVTTTSTLSKCRRTAL